MTTEEIERERHVIIEEINSMYDSPPDLVNQLIEETMWGDGPLGRDVAGSRETVSAVTRAQMLQFLRTYYVPRRTVVSVAGQVEHDEVVERVAAAFGAQDAGSALTAPRPSTATRPPRASTSSPKTPSRPMSASASRPSPTPIPTAMSSRCSTACWAAG